MLYAICNPIAGSGRSRRIGRRIQQILEEKGLPCHMEETQYPGHATQLAKQAREAGAQTVLAIGGDGTAYEVAQGLLGASCALGIIPAGTGNDFIKSIGVPADPLQALDHILSHPAQLTDVGELNGRMFLNEIGTGFDVTVLDYAQRAKKYCRGLLPYLYGVIQTLFRFRPFSVTYTVDGESQVTQDAFVVAAANGGMIGGGIPIAPQAKIDDGLLDVIVVGAIPRRVLLARLAGLMKGKILSFPETRYFRARSVTFSTPRMRLNVDGEIINEKAAQVRILPGALLIHR